MKKHNEIDNKEELDDELPENYLRHFLVIYSDHHSDTKYVRVLKGLNVESIIFDIREFYPKFSRYYIDIYMLRSKVHTEIQVIYDSLKGEYVYIE